MPSGTKTVYISIGNSDNKLSQDEWSDFCAGVAFAILNHRSGQHGEWYSLPNSAWQNACWCIEISPENEAALKITLASYARSYRQESIAWAEATTEFIASAKAVTGA